MLDDEAIARYARQIVIPGIGAAGQEKLVAATVLVVGHRLGVRQASLYLRAAGVRVVDSANERFDVAIAACPSSLDAGLRRMLEESDRPVCWYEIDPTGFTSGVHPESAMSPQRRDACDEDRLEHDAAACDAAGVACMTLLGLSDHPLHVTFESC